MVLRPSLRPGDLVRAVLVAVLGAALLAGCGGRAVPVATTGAGSDPLAVLRTWDAARSAAWSAADPVALAALYLPGSTSGRRDVALLESYRERGLRVAGIRMQRLVARVLVRDRVRMRVEVVERLLASRVESIDGGNRPRLLPAGQPRRRTIELRRLGGAWLVAEVQVVSRVRPGGQR